MYTKQIINKEKYKKKNSLLLMPSHVTFWDVNNLSFIVIAVPHWRILSFIIYIVYIIGRTANPIYQ